MTIETEWLEHVEPVKVRRRVYVVSWLANANGFPVTAAQMSQASFIKTEMHDTRDDALAHWDDLFSAHDLGENGPAFASCQDWTGESLV